MFKLIVYLLVDILSSPYKIVMLLTGHFHTSTCIFSPFLIIAKEQHLSKVTSQENTTRRRRDIRELLVCYHSYGTTKFYLHGCGYMEEDIEKGTDMQVDVTHGKQCLSSFLSSLYCLNLGNISPHHCYLINKCVVVSIKKILYFLEQFQAHSKTEQKVTHTPNISLYQHSHLSDTFDTIDEPTHQYHPKSMISIMVHSWCTFYGYGQIYNMYLQY